METGTGGSLWSEACGTSCPVPVVQSFAAIPDTEIGNMTDAAAYLCALFAHSGRRLGRTRRITVIRQRRRGAAGRFTDGHCPDWLT